MAKTALKKAPAQVPVAIGGGRRIAAGVFKAKCLGVMREIARTGAPVLVTNRGEPLVEVIPARNTRKKKRGDDFIGRWEGIIKINGDPADLVNPIFPLEDWDILR